MTQDKPAPDPPRIMRCPACRASVALRLDKPRADNAGSATAEWRCDGCGTFGLYWK